MRFELEPRTERIMKTTRTNTAEPPAAPARSAPVRSTPVAKLAVRIDGANPLHHLWDNNGTWWCHFTVHEVGNTKRRVRASLKTGDRELACRRRDRIFAQLSTGRGAA